MKPQKYVFITQAFKENVDIKDLKRLPDNKVKELGGEDYTKSAKKNTGKVNRIYIGILKQVMFIQFPKMEDLFNILIQFNSKSMHLS